MRLLYKPHIDPVWSLWLTLTLAACSSSSQEGVRTPNLAAEKPEDAIQQLERRAPNILALEFPDHRTLRVHLANGRSRQWSERRGWTTVDGVAPPCPPLTGESDKESSIVNRGDHFVTQVDGGLVFGSVTRIATNKRLAWKSRFRRLALSRDGRVVIGVNPDFIVIWRPDEGSAVAVRHGGYPRLAGLSADGRVLAVADKAVLELWDTGAARRYGTISLPAGTEHLAVAPDGGMVAASGPRWVRLYDRFGRDLARLGGARRRIEWTTTSPDTWSVALADYEGHVGYLDLRNGVLKWLPAERPMRTFHAEAFQLLFSPGGHWLAKAGPHPLAYVWDVAAESVQLRIVGDSEESPAFIDECHFRYGNNTWTLSTHPSDCQIGAPSSVDEHGGAGGALELRHTDMDGLGVTRKADGEVLHVIPWDGEFGADIIAVDDHGAVAHAPLELVQGLGQEVDVVALSRPRPTLDYFSASARE